MYTGKSLVFLKMYNSIHATVKVHVHIKLNENDFGANFETRHHK